MCLLPLLNARWLLWRTKRDVEAAQRLRSRAGARFDRACRALASLEAEIAAGRIVLR